MDQGSFLFAGKEEGGKVEKKDVAEVAGKELVKTKRKGNGRNSPVIGDNGLKAAPGEIAKITREALEVGFMWEPINTKDPEQIRDRAIEYLNYCIEHDSRPGNMGLYTAWGIDRRVISQIVNGKVNHPAVDTIKKCLDILSSIREKLMADGKLNPVTGTFLQKNFDGLKDQQDIVITPNKEMEADSTPEQIEADIPIDVEAEEL